MHQGTVILWAMAQVDHPFMEPDAFESARGHLRNGSQNVWPAERAKTVLRQGANVRIAGIEGRIDAQQNQCGSKVRLVQRVHVGKSRQGASIAEEAERSVKHQVGAWNLAVLNPLELVHRRHEILAGKEVLQLLVQRLRAIERGLDHELRDRSEERRVG